MKILFVETKQCECAVNFESPIYNDTFTQNEVLETLEEGSCVCGTQNVSVRADPPSSRKKTRMLGGILSLVVSIWQSLRLIKFVASMF